MNNDECVARRMTLVERLDALIDRVERLETHQKAQFENADGHQIRLSRLEEETGLLGVSSR